MSAKAVLTRSCGQLPLLFRNATKRTSGDAIPGAYDPSSSVWVVEEGAISRPLVEVATMRVIEITTKTRVLQETDDEDDRILQTEGQSNDSLRTRLPNGAAELMELVTKTMVNQESDDDFVSAAQLLELETKTEAQVEHDDQSDPVL